MDLAPLTSLISFWRDVLKLELRNPPNLKWTPRVEPEWNTVYYVEVTWLVNDISLYYFNIHMDTHNHWVGRHNKHDARCCCCRLRVTTREILDRFQLLVACNFLLKNTIQIKLALRAANRRVNTKYSTGIWNGSSISNKWWRWRTQVDFLQ